MSSWLFLASVLLACANRAGAHVFIFEFYRVGAPPAYDGSGWIGEAFLNLPEEATAHLIAAENYVADREPDFTFRTPYIDFPAGPVAHDLDASFETMGDFLNDYIHDVSDPSMLDQPFGSFALRFSGLLRVSLDSDIQSQLGGEVVYGLPVWVEFGSLGFDGYRTRIVDSIYRLPLVNPAAPFFHENSIVLGLGLFPIEITYFNRYDPEGTQGMERAGIELYSWHGGGLPWPGGENVSHPQLGAMTVVPPRIIYQTEDIVPISKGDFDTDGDVDFVDFQWGQTCFSGPGDEGGIFLEIGCNALDFDDDGDVDLIDIADFQSALAGPGQKPLE